MIRRNTTFGTIVRCEGGGAEILSAERAAELVAEHEAQEQGTRTTPKPPRFERAPGEQMEIVA